MADVTVAQFAEVQPILWGEIEKVLSNQKEPQEALDYAADQATQIFQRDGLIEVRNRRISVTPQLAEVS